jgi:uncharacterized integral membrane protein (TIGR00698 family)
MFVALAPFRRLLPGVLLCAVLGLAAVGLQGLEVRLAGRAWLEALVIAILLGAAVRALWTPGAAWSAGIDFSAKVLLEVAVALLGATVSAASLAAMGPATIGGVAMVVLLSVAGGYGLVRLFGLPRRMAVLVACGNSICGNSAIAAVAPVIGAEPDDVASAIAFTAVLGIGVVLAVPVVAALLQLSPVATGAFAGLTVYAVPQVLAATAPAGALAAQTGTLVKLVRVLALGPVCLALGLLAGRGGRRMHLRRLVPWFVAAFLVLAAARALGVLPAPAFHAAGQVSGWLTVAAMAALGLGVDLKSLARAGPRVCAAAGLSLLLLAGLALGLLALLGWT